MAYKTRETIFDQSIATQERIDIILRSLHDICMQPVSLQMINMYQRNIIRLKKEVQTKFSKGEDIKNKEYIDVINRLRLKWGNAIQYPGNKQSMALAEIHEVLSSYEDWLYKSLDRHGLLMRDRADETDALKV